MIQGDWKDGKVNDIDKAQKHLEGYTFSSYLDYQRTQSRLYGLVLNKEAFPDYFSEPKEFSDFINDWLELKAEDLGRRGEVELPPSFPGKNLVNSS
ncbi:MAG: hypothetical protein NT041_01855 [Candidatus Vogelbacteria bacterium]|nr:hypothetical protein [Candidatus Vogelbacteria bacterium]